MTVQWEEELWTHKRFRELQTQEQLLSPERLHTFADPQRSAEPASGRGFTHPKSRKEPLTADSFPGDKQVFVISCISPTGTEGSHLLFHQLHLQDVQLLPLRLLRFLLRKVNKHFRFRYSPASSLYGDTSLLGWFEAVSEEGQMLLVLEEATLPAPFTALVYPPTGIQWRQGLSQHESPHNLLRSQDLVEDTLFCMCATNFWMVNLAWLENE